MFNNFIRYQDNQLYCDSVAVQDIINETGTPVYIYSLTRTLDNLARIRKAFSALNPHIHYSAKANSSLAIMHALIADGAGIDAVSAGEIHKALKAGANPQDIVFAGVGKTPGEIQYAVEQGVGWFNVENIAECKLINDAAAANGTTARIALRFNPEVTADTHPYIATGHGGAKFGLTAEVIDYLLAHQSDYPKLEFAGIHLHIGSQLHDTAATREAVESALKLIETYPHIRTVNIGGGLPVAYSSDEHIPEFSAFAATLQPLLEGYTVLLEPGRAIIADAGMLISTILYVKKHAGQTFYITDASMAELIRPALYQAHHEIVPLNQQENGSLKPVTVVGPVCETTDVLGRDTLLPELNPGDSLAILTAGAYGMVMASNYNQRLRPPEVIVNGDQWSISRRRETWDDLLKTETL